ncbi:MAG: hypothetical protein JXP36_17905 [Bacteroidales bacterium]|nr:hypothetical protein [Bacteroidales bacterium]
MQHFCYPANLIDKQTEDLFHRLHIAMHHAGNQPLFELLLNQKVPAPVPEQIWFEAEKSELMI